MVTLYAILGVSPNASLQELRTAFKRNALAVHPDKGGTKEAFQCLLVAFETLADPWKRRRYDTHLAGSADSAGTLEKPPRGQSQKNGTTCSEGYDGGVPLQPQVPKW